MICVTSVPQTGTQFVIDHLLESFERCTEMPAERGYFYMHVYQKGIPEIRGWLKQYPCIVPMRHPLKVAKSWRAREKPVGEMCDFYRRLVTAVDPFEPFYIPLDVPTRQTYLDLINESLGLGLETDWPVWKSTGLKGTLADHDQALVTDLIDELSGFFGRFGYVA